MNIYIGIIYKYVHPLAYIFIFLYLYIVKSNKNG